MKCPFCGGEDSRVVDSRPTEDKTSIRRRRECENCSKRFTTYEKLEHVQLLVIKKDQTRELFLPDKIRAGIIHACHKRPVTAKQIDDIVSKVEQMAYNSLKQEVTTKQIGEMVMDELRELDEVAYVRFASVYRQFTDIPSFMQELRNMMKERN
ncbi:MAG: transcriptional regulator NrdR [Eubacteriales bacterium]|nr:transcriptional regulator NrdR [Eubacteriales bacterium]